MIKKKQTKINLIRFLLQKSVCVCALPTRVRRAIFFCSSKSVWKKYYYYYFFTLN